VLKRYALSWLVMLILSGSVVTWATAADRTPPTNPAIDKQVESLDRLIQMKIEKLRELVARQLGKDPSDLGEGLSLTVEVRETEDHWFVQFYDVVTGVNTGCHDKQNQTSCEGTCPCND